MHILCSIGDLGEFPKHGSLHQYLLHLHVNGEVPVTSFWWGKTHIVSVCSPQAFRELVGLVHRPGKGCVCVVISVGAVCARCWDEGGFGVRKRP